MEVSNEIKEEIRKTQTDLKNAIRIHQVWIARLQDDEHNSHLKCKVNEAEKDILSIGQTQKRVVERLRRELELYQQRLKARNKQVNVESDNRYIAQQLRDHQLQYKSKNKSLSLLKPSVLSEIHIKSENNTDTKNNSSYENSDAENEQKITAEECKDKENGSFTDLENSTLRENKSVKDNSFINNVQDSRLNFTNALNKAKESFIGHKQHGNTESWQDGSGSPGSEQFSPQNASELSPTPSPPPLPGPGELITQEAFLRLVGLVTPRQKDALEKKRSERKKRSTTSTNKNEFIYGNFDLPPKRKKYNQFPYLQSTATPPQTRSQRLRRQQKQQACARGRDSREGSPSGSSSDNKGGPSFVQQPPWAASLPSGLTVEPVHSGNRRSCAGCGRSDVPSLLIHCGACSCSFHTGCGASAARASPGAPRLCPSCGCEVREARLHGATVAPAGSRNGHSVDIFKDIPFSEKQLERKLLQEKNAQLSLELRKLEVRAANLKENLDAHNAEKSELLSHQIRTQRNLQKLLDFVGQFKETSISIRSTSGSDTASERSKSNEE